MSVRTAVRDAGPGDAEAVARLCAQLGYPVSAADVALRLAALLADARYWVGVAESDECIVGWIVAEQRLTLEGGDTCEITGLVVDTAARRAGAGRVLVAAALDWAKSRGAPTMSVRSNIARPASHAFYRALGFEHRKTQHAYAMRTAT